MRIILHLDLDAYFCAVEEIDDPALHGKPFAVGGRPEERGVVASCSYAARAFGVHSAMPMKLAIRQCPDLLIVEPHRDRYSELSHQVMERLHNLSPLVEQISIDEAFVDISDLREPPEQTARQVQQQIWDELHLPCSIGVAANKLVAKIATETGKKAARGAGYPRAIRVVAPGGEAEFLSPLPAAMLWGVGEKTEAVLAGLGMRTIGDIAKRPEADLIQRFGKNGRELSRHASGLDDRPVVAEREVKSVSQEVTFSQDVSSDQTLEATLKSFSTQLARSLRHDKLVGKTVKLKLRWPDFTTLTRQVTLPTPTDQEGAINEAAISLLRQARSSGKAVRLIGLGLSGLSAAMHQMELWGQPQEKQRKVRAVLDELQEKFGKNVIDKGRTLR